MVSIIAVPNSITNEFNNDEEEIKVLRASFFSQIFSSFFSEYIVMLDYSAPMFLLFVVIHCTQGSYMFEILWPSLFYYFASQAPFLVQHLRWTVSNYGLKVRRLNSLCNCNTSNSNHKLTYYNTIHFFLRSPMLWIFHVINLKAQQLKLTRITTMIHQQKLG